MGSQYGIAPSLSGRAPSPVHAIPAGQAFFEQSNLQPPMNFTCPFGHVFGVGGVGENPAAGIQPMSVDDSSFGSGNAMRKKSPWDAIFVTSRSFFKAATALPPPGDSRAIVTSA